MVICLVRTPLCFQQVFSQWMTYTTWQMKYRQWNCWTIPMWWPCMIGVCVCVSIGGGPAIIIPYMENGSLLSYLRKDKTNITTSDDQDLDIVRYTILLLLWYGKLNFTFNFNFWLFLTITTNYRNRRKLMRIYVFRCIILLKSCWACKCINWQCHCWSECNQ